MAQVEDTPVTLDVEKCKRILLDGLTDSQKAAVQSDKRRVLIVAGAGSGKTEVMARRIAWWTAVEGVPKNKIVAFTFTERAAEEMKFRIRERVQRVTPPGEDATLGGMYIGTIHGFCIAQLRALAPDVYHNYDILDEASRHALVQRGYDSILGLPLLEASLGKGRFATIATFLQGYDLLNEYGELDVEFASAEMPAEMPAEIWGERDWCKGARMRTDVGADAVSEAFEVAAGRYYAYLDHEQLADVAAQPAVYGGDARPQDRRPRGECARHRTGRAHGEGRAALHGAGRAIAARHHGPGDGGSPARCQPRPVTTTLSPPACGRLVWRVHCLGGVCGGGHSTQGVSA